MPRDGRQEWWSLTPDEQRLLSELERTAFYKPMPLWAREQLRALLARIERRREQALAAEFEHA